MTALLWLIPAALVLGAMGLLGFFWAMKSGQYDDLDGAAERILIDDDGPIVDEDER
ncbi:cbb3-type cytochrome oxidase assembly protein CcoS [Oceanicaulis alexandrii]|uniref:cbb3-type cytochrome oxidase assembly protein CcoS n=1 Tax=Oceanicaulis TaxID=153232 RepID=UPI0035CECA70